MVRAGQRAEGRALGGVAPALVVLIACAAAGSWTLVGQWVGRWAYVLVPEALGVPSGLPPLRMSPLGGTTRDQWIADLVAALVLTLVVWWRCRWTRHRVFGPWFAVIAGLCVATTIRVAHLVLVTGHDLISYSATLILALVLAVAVGALLGIPVALVHVLATRRRRAAGAPAAASAGS